jgi:hypothetical protein
MNIFEFQGFCNSADDPQQKLLTLKLEEQLLPSDRDCLVGILKTTSTFHNWMKYSPSITEGWEHAVA